MRKDPRSTVGYNLKSKADDLSQPFFKRKQVGDVSSHLPNRGQGEAWGGGETRTPELSPARKGAGGGGLALPAGIHPSFLCPQQEKGCPGGGSAVWVLRTPPHMGLLQLCTLTRLCPVSRVTHGNFCPSQWDRPGEPTESCLELVDKCQHTPRWSPPGVCPSRCESVTRFTAIPAGTESSLPQTKMKCKSFCKLTMRAKPSFCFRFFKHHFKRNFS